MADLGLGALTDDQLLELLQQACGELAARDPLVANLAQATIFSEADKLKALKEGAREAVLAVRKKFEQQVAADVAKSVRQKYKDGKLTLLTAEEEVKLAVKSEIQTRIALIDEAVAQLKGGGIPSGERFAFEISGMYIAFTHGGHNYQMAHRIAPAVADQIGANIRALLEFADG